MSNHELPAMKSTANTGYYTFRWDKSTVDMGEIESVYVTGTFDGWSKSQRMVCAVDGEHWEKTVELKREKISYKFVVNGAWITNPNAPIETEANGTQNNILLPEDIIPKPTPEIMSADLHNANISSAAPESTTAALAAGVPLVAEEKASIAADPLYEGAGAPHSANISSAHPESSTAALAAQVPLETEKNGFAHKNGSAHISSVAPQSTTAELAGQQPLEKQSPIADQFKQSDSERPTPALDSVPGFFPETPVAEKGEQTYSVKPLPASDTAENPITLTPGEPIPSSITAQSLDTHVTLDKESYEQGARNYPIGNIQLLPEVVTPAAQREAEGRGVLDLPPIMGNMIPESSLPIVGGSKLSGKQPKEEDIRPPGFVPEVVQDSQEQAHVGAAASGVPLVVDQKAQVEAEIHNEVPVAPAIDDTAFGAVVDSAKSTANMVVENAAPVANTAVEQVKSTANTVAENAAPFVNTAAEQAKVTANTVAQNAVPVANATVENTKYAVNVVADRAVPTANTIAEQAKDAANTVTEQVAPVANTVVEKSQEAAGTVADTTAPITATITEKAAQAGAAITAGVASVAAATGLYKTTSGSSAAENVPTVVRESQEKAHVDAEAAAVPSAVEAKHDMETELLHEVQPAPAVHPKTTAGLSTAVDAGPPVPAKDIPIPTKPVDAVPAAVKDSLHQASKAPEAAGVASAVENKTAMESELKKEVSPVPPASTIRAVASEEPPKNGSAAGSGPSSSSAAAPVTTTTTASAGMGPIGMAASFGEAKNGSSTTEPATSATSTTPSKPSQTEGNGAKKSLERNPGDSPSASSTDKSAKRRSWFGKLKDKVIHHRS